MDINYLKKYEPLFGDYHVKKKLGEGGSGAVFEIEREDFGQTYSAAVKAISIPNDSDVIDTLMLQGDDPSRYCYKMAESIRTEVETMSKLKGNSNIVSYENHKTIPHQDGIGWDILIKMELLTPLIKYLQDKTVDEKMVIRIGIDMCRALELCHKEGIIHRDIKPSNIFYSEQGTFKLGDFGVSKISMEDYAGTKVGTLPYMAPEVFNGEKYEKNVDIYSLGLVLYMLANNYLLPFEEKGSSSAARTIAQSKRTAGVPLPKPANAGPELTRVILRACAFEPRARYQNATDMRKELETCLNEDEGGKVVVVDPPSSPEPKSPEPEPTNKKVLIAVIAAVAFIIAVIIAIAVASNSVYRNTEIGDIVEFGYYEQDNDTSDGQEAIEWRVLDKEDGKLLLISEYGLDAKPYNEELEDVTWEDCTLRTWLNDDFMDEAFSDEDIEMIELTTVKAEDNEDYDTAAGEDTEDYVFLLSISETDEYFEDDEDRRCLPTEYAVAQGAYTEDGYNIDGKDTCWWCLRSPGEDSYALAGVFANGSVDSDGDDVDTDDGSIRPALWIKP